MRNRLRILLLLVLALVLIAAGILSADPEPEGIICDPFGDPTTIPCSTYNTATCTYTQSGNCCISSSASHRPCIGVCC
jgi:hypothetical protein